MLTWPLSTGFNLGWQATPFQKATLQYQFRFDGYVKDRTTADSFVVPSSTVTQGIGSAWEYRRAGYSLLLNGTWFGRAAWRPWGSEEQPGPVDTETSQPDVREIRGRAVARFLSAAVSEDSPERRMVQRPRPRSLREVSVRDVRRYPDPRRAGVGRPLRRAGDGRAGRTRSTSSEQYRVDLFADRAWGRDDPGHGPWDPITGFGIAVNTRTPWNTMLRVDVGKSLLPARYNTLGSTTLQILLLKPLR